MERLTLAGVLQQHLDRCAEARRNSGHQFDTTFDEARCALESWLAEGNGTRIATLLKGST